MTELILIRAADEPSLVAEVSRLVAFIDRVPEVALADVAYTCALKKGARTLAVIADDVPSLRARLVSARDRLASGKLARIRDKSGTYYYRESLLGEGEGRGKLAFVYPGVMGFYPDMLRDLAIAYPPCRSAFDELEEALKDDPSFTPSSFVFPPAPYYRHDADIFASGAYAQALVSIYAANLALTRLLESTGVRPDGVVGFAGGDLAATMRSGAVGDLPRPQRIRFISEIYKLVNKAVNHGGFPKVAVLSVVLRREGEIDDAVAAFAKDKVFLAVDLSPRQKVFAVAEDCADVVSSALAHAGARVRALALDRPFNTPLCASLVPAVRKFADAWIRDDPACDVYSCAAAGRMPSGKRAMRKDASERWAKSARFRETVRQMFADGYRVFLEVGPRGLMTAATTDTLRGEDFAAIALNSIHRSGRLQLLHALGQVAALGGSVDTASAYERRGAKALDFDAAISLEVRRDAEMRLSRAFPRLTLLASQTPLSGASFLAEPKGRGAKAAARAAAIAQQSRRQRQFDFGALNPLVSDADQVASAPGVSVEIAKDFRVSDLPFLGDYALGTSQMSYSDPNLRGLLALMPTVGAEIMVETAQLVMPNRVVLRIEDLVCRRMIAIEKGAVRLTVKAERVPAAAPEESAFKVQIRDECPNAAFTWAPMEATVVLAETLPPSRPVAVDPLTKPRSVHWSGRDVYPSRLSCGRRLRGVTFVEAWSESGLDYEVEVPPLAGNVTFTRFPLWAVNPLLLEAIVSGFPLWRSHERFAGAFSFPFRVRRIVFGGVAPGEGDRLKCYMRLTGVTPRSHLCDITATDGNGKELISISGWEELTERVPLGYRALILQPATTFLTEPLGKELVGNPSTDFATAFVTDVPYPIFERNEELWLKTLSHVVLDASERREFAEMPGSTSRRTEWLFGRIAAKEAVRRFLKDFYQARWSDADVRIWPDDSGKPHALGAWNDYLSTKLDIAIAHTAQFVVAVAAANARVGIDVESTVRDLSEEFAAGVFTPEELDLAAQAANASQAVIKFWCAKEAVSKTLGTGIRYSPKEMVVTGFLADSGTLTVRLEGAWVEAFKTFRGRDITVTVRTFRDHALASCFVPSSLFVEE